MSAKNEGQTTLADFGQQSASESNRGDKKKATPEDDSDASTDNQTDEVEIVIEMDENGVECQNCGNHVSDDFARTYGDNEGRVHACMECCTNRDELRSGATAGVERSNGEKTVSLMQKERGQHAPDEV